MPNLDERGWVAVGFFLLFGVLFVLRANVPGLLADQLTADLLKDLERGGVLAVIGYWFVSSKKDEPPQ